MISSNKNLLLNHPWYLLIRDVHENIPIDVVTLGNLKNLCSRKLLSQFLERLDATQKTDVRIMGADRIKRKYIRTVSTL